MLLHEAIKERLNIDKCLISAYYKSVDVLYYNEDGTYMYIQESASDLINGSNNFAIDVSDMNVTINTVESRFNTLIVEVRPHTDNYLVTWTDEVCINKYRPFSTLREAKEFVNKFPSERIVYIYKDCKAVGIKARCSNLKFTRTGCLLIREESRR